MHTKHRLPENAQLGISSLVAWLWLWFYDNLVGDLSQDTFFVGAGSSLREYANNHTRYKERKKNSIKNDQFEKNRYLCPISFMCQHDSRELHGKHKKYLGKSKS